jgi:1,4-dihydroxy-2-naphthoyl-CoA synthase
VCDDVPSVLQTARQCCRTLATHGPHALRSTKAWLNELDGSLDDDRFDGPAVATADAAVTPEAVEHLRSFWSKRSGERPA